MSILGKVANILVAGTIGMFLITTLASDKKPLDPDTKKKEDEEYEEYMRNLRKYVLNDDEDDDL